MSNETLDQIYQRNKRTYKGLEWPDKGRGRVRNSAPDGVGYIYGILHPSTKEIRYIGQTTKTIKYRLQTHINSAKRANSNLRNTPLGKWLYKLLKNGNIPKIIQIEETTVEGLNDAEIRHIREGRERHRLLNVADGGVASPRNVGHKQPKAFCINQSKQRSGLKNQNFVDLTGRRFNKLTVIWLSGFKNRRSYWLCKCDCGNLKILNSTRLKRSRTCGCAKKTRWTLEERQRLSVFTKTKRKIDEATKRFVA